MILWFLRGLRRGIVTTRYPAAGDSWARQLPSPPAFDPGLLTETLVDQVVAICPNQALRRQADELVLDLGACTGCGLCFGEAAVPSGEFELASRSRQKLIKRIPIGGGK